MPAKVEDILSETDDAQLCDHIYDWIVDRYGEHIDVSQIGEHERVVLCVLNAKCIIDNCR